MRANGKTLPRVAPCEACREKGRTNSDCCSVTERVTCRCSQVLALGEYLLSRTSAFVL